MFLGYRILLNSLDMMKLHVDQIKAKECEKCKRTAVVPSETTTNDVSHTGTEAVKNSQMYSM